MIDSERIAQIEQWILDTKPTLADHNKRCNDLDNFKRKWVVIMILLGVVFGSIGTMLFSSKEWLWDSIPVPKHYHEHHHDKNGDMVIGEGIWGK